MSFTQIFFLAIMLVPIIIAAVVLSRIRKFFLMKKIITEEKNKSPFKTLTTVFIIIGVLLFFIGVMMFKPIIYIPGVIIIFTFSIINYINGFRKDLNMWKNIAKK